MNNQTHTQSQVRATARALALAFVLVGATFLVAPEAEAQGSGCSGIKELTFPFGNQVTTRQGQTLTTRQITVGQTGDPNIVQVDFLMPRNVDDPTEEWILWEQAYSEAFGWTVQVDNKYTQNHALLRFTVTDDEYSIQGCSVPFPGVPRVPFTLGFSTFEDAPVGDQYEDVDVIGYYPDGSTTLTSIVEFFEDERRPEVLPAGALTLDRDGNGRLDAMLVTFDEILDMRTFNPAEWEVQDYTVTQAYPTNLGGKFQDTIPALDIIYEPYEWYGYCPLKSTENQIHGCSQVIFELEEIPGYDTGVMPQIRASSVSLSDYAGNKLATVTSTLETVVDGARPILVSATAANVDADDDDYEVVRLLFSEDVQWSNNPGRTGDGSEGCTTNNNASECVLSPRVLGEEGDPTYDETPGDTEFCPREPTYWRLLPQSFDYFDSTDGLDQANSVTKLVDVALRGDEKGADCVHDHSESMEPSDPIPPPYISGTHTSDDDPNMDVQENRDGWIQHPPCWWNDFACDPHSGNLDRPYWESDEEYLGQVRRAGDLSRADLILATPLRFEDIDVDNPDQIACGQIEGGPGSPTDGHVRDMGNGGNIYWNVATTPASDVAKTNGYNDDVDAPDDPGHGLTCDPTRRVDVQPPGMIRADTDIWGDFALVQFNVPVALYDPEEQDELEALIPQAFDVITTNGGGPRGIIHVTHEPCTAFAIIHFRASQKVLPTDVDDTPTMIRSAPDMIRSCNSGVDLNNPFDDVVILPVVERPLIDQIQPRVVRAETMDQDSNGVVDSFFVKWSEPIRDSSFCELTNPCPPKKLIDLADRDNLRFYDMPLGTGVWSRYGPFSFDTDLAVDDDEMIISWEEVLGESCSQDCARGPGHPNAIHTGVVPHLQIFDGLVEDLVPRGVTGAPYPQPNINLRQDGPNFIAERGTARDVFEVDRAPPVIWNAQTTDREVNLRLAANDGECKIGGDDICPPDPDGMLDGYRITFSEPVADFISDDEDDRVSFHPDNWNVEGYQVTGAKLENRVEDGFYDDVMLLEFAERPELRGDTGLRPDLTYDLVNTTVNPMRGLVDWAGNVMLPFGSQDVIEVDDARPAIWAVEGFVGSTQLNVTFSEPVDDGQGKPVVRRDLTYANGNGANGVAGFAISTRSEPGEQDPAEVKHEPGSKFAVVPLEGPLTQGDVDADSVAAFVKSIRETAPTVVDKKFILNTIRPIGHHPDVNAPCAIDLVNVDRITANSLRLSWLAPDEDCVDDPALGGPVSGYRFAVRTAPFERSDSLLEGKNEFDAFNITIELAQIVDGVEEIGAIAVPENTQNAILSGLPVDTAHYVQVVAVDEANNVGPIGHQPVFGRTTNDTTPPVPKDGFGGLEIESETHDEGVPTLSLRAKLKWDGMEDPDSDIQYRWALNADPDYQVVRGDKATTGQSLDVTIPGDGQWYFHVRAYSAGGAAPSTATYHLNIGAVDLSDEDLSACDQEANDALEVERRGGINRLSWELPDCADNLGSDQRQLVALWVWRLDPGFGYYRAVTVLEGDYTALKDFHFDDPDTSPILKDSRYAIQLEFASGNNVQAAGQRAQDPAPSDVPGVAPESLDPGEIPAWIWIVLGVALALVIAGLVIFFVLRGRDRRDAATTAAGYQWEEIGGGPSGIDQASGLPIHDIQCPSCGTQFQSLGHTPLEVTCPNCRISGTLD